MSDLWEAILKQESGKVKKLADKYLRDIAFKKKVEAAIRECADSESPLECVLQKIKDEL